MNLDLITLTGYLITPVSGAIGWLVGSRRRKITAIGEMQDTINLLVAKNNEYLTEMVSVKKELTIVRMENAELKKGQELMTGKLEELQRENQELKRLREENEGLRQQVAELLNGGGVPEGKTAVGKSPRTKPVKPKTSDDGGH